MCITAIALNAHPNYPFVLLFNRDEAFERPTSEVIEWADQWDGIVAGRDLMGGGTWLGVNKDGKFVALTNFTDEDEELIQQYQANPSTSIQAGNNIGYLTRGYLPLRLLRRGANFTTELEYIWQERSRYKSFNLFAGDMKNSELYYLSVNQKGAFQGVKKLDEGVYCMSNTDLFTEWEKTKKLKGDLENFLSSHNDLTNADLLPLLTTEFNDNEPPEKESSVFIRAYEGEMFGTPATRGTVSSTAIVLNSSGEVSFLERTWSKDQRVYIDTEKRFAISN